MAIVHMVCAHYYDVSCIFVILVWNEFHIKLLASSGGNHVHSIPFRVTGQVLLHPKLKDPSLLIGKKGEIIFPLVEVLEPELANIVERLKNVTVIGEQEELQVNK